MRDDEIVTFANAYIGEMIDSSAQGARHWVELDELIDSAPAIAWSVLTIIIDNSPDMFVHQIGAGPLEALLSSRPELFREAIARALRDLKFREALRYVRGVNVPS